MRSLTNLNSLPIDLAYEIIAAKTHKTKLGEVVLSEFRENFVFLPNRVSETFKPVVGNLVEK